MAGFLYSYLYLLVLCKSHAWTIHRLSNVASFSRLYVATTTTTSSSSARVEKSYDASAITVLEGLEPVRKRPGMYIGSTGVKGLHHVVFEVVDNSVDEALAGHCTNIVVTLHKDGSVEVEDNGRGIPCALHPTTGKSTLETVLCVLHAGGKFGGDDSGYKVSGGLHGVGISVVNALSDYLQVQVVRDNKHHSMEFSKGVPLSSIKIRDVETGDMARGTKVIFKPDASIFKTTLNFQFDKIAGRLDELAYLNAGLNITMIDRRSKSSIEAASSDQSEQLSQQEDAPSVVTKAEKLSSKIVIKADEDEDDEVDLAPRVVNFKHDGGIKELVEELCSGKTNLHEDVPIIYINEEKKGVVVELAMRWSKDQYADALTGFANGIRYY